MIQIYSILKIGLLLPKKAIIKIIMNQHAFFRVINLPKLSIIKLLVEAPRVF
jgi:hypothetical protein